MCNAVMDATIEQSGKSAVKILTTPDVCFLEEEVMDYPMAEIYIGPRPSYVPQAELIVETASHSFVHSCKSHSSPLTSDVVLNARSDTYCMSMGVFVNDMESDSGSSSSKHVVENAIDFCSHDLIDEGARDASGAKTKDRDFLNAGDGFSIAVNTVSPIASLTGDPTEGTGGNASGSKVISQENVFADVQLEAGEPLPFSEHEDPCSPLSDPFGRRSSASHSSTNSCSEELLDERCVRLSPPVRKKGECFLCTKVNRVQRKETCLVCDAKYCCDCFLEAMGSMLEGRKCSGCVGKPICESKRRQLGKPSKILRRRLHNLEVEQVMKAERECPANKLRPQQFSVNGRPLTGKEFDELLGCAHPPSKLKPGRYWYDAQCGYWGKEGKKPEKIISANLNIGGELLGNASAGTTGVYINNREITKAELKMLKIAGFPFPPSTRLWVEYDGSFKQEGNNRICGNIYKKKRAMVLGYLLSLPNRPTTAREPIQSALAYYEQDASHKILLLGHAGSGTSTIMKQIRFLYDKAFTPVEMQNIKTSIQKNVWHYLLILLNARERFEDEENNIIKQVEENSASSSSGDTGVEPQSAKKNIYALNARLSDQATWFLETDASEEVEKCLTNVIQNHASCIEELWKDPAIQATYRRRAELHYLPDAAEHFLEKVVSIASNDYSPSENDILLAGVATNDIGLAEVQFEDSGSLEYSLPESRFHVIRVNGSGIKNHCKLFKLFDEVGAVVFCVALDSYDQTWSNGTNPLQNKMVLSRDLFESIIKFSFCRDKPVILLLNKYDAFEQKVFDLDVPLTTCEWFSDFRPIKSSKWTREMVAEAAYTYIANKFKRHFEACITNSEKVKLYTYSLKALERSSVAVALMYVQTALLEKTPKQGLPSASVYSSETSSLLNEVGP